MLEAWFATLGSRLGVVVDTKEGAGKMPAALQQAMSKLWDTALSQAQQEASQGIIKVNEALATERVALDSREAEMARRDLSLDERQSTMTEALTLAKNQLAQTASQVKELQSTVALRDRALVENQSALDNVQRHRDADRKHYDQQASQQADALRRAEARASANERRLLAEIDRSRQEVKNTQAAHADKARRIEILSAEKEEAIQALNRICHAAELEAASLREKLASADIRIAELQCLLQQLTPTTNAAIERVGRSSTKAGARQKPSPSSKRASSPRKA